MSRAAQLSIAVRQDLCVGIAHPGGNQFERAPYTLSSRDRNRSPLAVLPVRLLLDEARTELYVDALLDRGALVVGQVHRARQLDKIAIEALFGFLVADAILDVPQALVDVLQRALIERDVACGAAAVPPGLLQQRQFQLNVGELAGIEDAHLLDSENGELVEQLARRDGNEDVFHGRDPSNSSSFAVTCATLMRSMTPGSSILWFHGSSPGSQPRKARAAWGYASTHQRPDRYGPLRAGLVAAYSPTTGVPTMVAMCTGPESGLTSTLARDSSASNSGRVSLPIWLTSLTPQACSISAPVRRSSSLGPPARLTRMRKRLAACCASAA